MKTENNYDKLKQVAKETSPLPVEKHDIPTRVIDVDLVDDTKDKAQLEVEVDIEKHGVPVIDVERPPVPDVKTDTTPYKKVEVARKEKRSDGKPERVEEVSLKEDREMKAFAEKLCIPKRKSLLQRLMKKLSDFGCKIHKFAFNVANRRKRKKIQIEKHTHDEHVLPEGVQTVALKVADERSTGHLGRDRSFQREGDKTSQAMQMIRNKKTGVVVATPNISAYKTKLEDEEKDISDYEVVESQVKG